MTNTRISTLLGALAFAALTFGAVGCKDLLGVDDDNSTVEVVSLYTVFDVDQALLESDEQLPTYDEFAAGTLLTDDGGQVLLSLDNDSTHRHKGRHGRGGGHHGKGEGDSCGVKRDDSTVRKHNIESLLASLPGMTDSLALLLKPCFESYRATVKELRGEYNGARRELRAGFNAEIKALIADTTLTREEKRARFETLKGEYQAAARELKEGLKSAMESAKAQLVECVSEYLTDEQLDAFRKGLAGLR